MAVWMWVLEDEGVVPFTEPQVAAGEGLAVIIIVLAGEGCNYWGTGVGQD